MGRREEEAWEVAYLAALEACKKLQESAHKAKLMGELALAARLICAEGLPREKDVD